MIDFWVAFSDVVIVKRGLTREGWIRYRWERRHSRDHDLLTKGLNAVPSDQAPQPPCGGLDYSGLLSAFTKLTSLARRARYFM